MSLSTDTRESIFKRTEIMRKIQFTFKSDTKKEDFFTFLSKKGKFIRKLKLQINLSAEEFIEKILPHVPN